MCTINIKQIFLLEILITMRYSKGHPQVVHVIVSGEPRPLIGTLFVFVSRTANYEQVVIGLVPLVIQVHISKVTRKVRHHVSVVGDTGVAGNSVRGENRKLHVSNSRRPEGE